MGWLTTPRRRWWRYAARTCVAHGLDGDAGAFAFSINEQPGRALGEAGDTVTAEIDRTNYQSFINRP